MAGRPREFDVDQALESALTVFRQKGFEGTSLPDLTEAMGINRPSLYAAFGNKEELFRKALDRYTEKALAGMQEALAAPTARAAVEKLLCAVASGAACPKSPKGCLHVQGALSGSDDSRAIRDELAARRSHAEFLMRQRFERAIAEGDLSPTVSAADLAAYVATVMQGMAVQSSSGASSDALRNIAQMALQVFPDQKA